ncbi:MAG: hypothetical protein P0S96_06200 [Simkaniaceae bacterium]|nr:hypothetical protein [Candidatus Sacchlamyda saccharinae]
MSAIQSDNSSGQFGGASVAIVASTALIALTCLVRAVFNRTAMPPREDFNTTRKEVDSHKHPYSGKLWKCVAEHRSKWLKDGVVYEYEYNDSLKAKEAHQQAFPASEPTDVGVNASNSSRLLQLFLKVSGWENTESIEPFKICGFSFLEEKSPTPHVAYVPSPEILKRLYGFDVAIQEKIASNTEFIENFVAGKFTISREEYAHDLMKHGFNLAPHQLLQSPWIEKVREDVGKFHARIMEKKREGNDEVKKAADLAEQLLAFWVDVYTVAPNEYVCPIPWVLIGTVVHNIEKIDGASSWWEKTSIPYIGASARIQKPTELCVNAFMQLGLMEYNPAADKNNKGK